MPQHDKINIYSIYASREAQQEENWHRNHKPFFTSPAQTELGQQEVFSDGIKEVLMVLNATGKTASKNRTNEGGREGGYYPEPAEEPSTELVDVKEEELERLELPVLLMPGEGKRQEEEEEEEEEDSVLSVAVDSVLIQPSGAGNAGSHNTGQHQHQQVCMPH